MPRTVPSLATVRVLTVMLVDTRVSAQRERSGPGLSAVEESETDNDCDVRVFLTPLEDEVLERVGRSRSCDDEVAAGSTAFQQSSLGVQEIGLPRKGCLPELRPVELDILVLEGAQAIDEVVRYADRSRIGLQAARTAQRESSRGTSSWGSRSACGLSGSANCSEGTNALLFVIPSSWTRLVASNALCRAADEADTTRSQ